MGPVCGQRWPFQDWTERPAMAVASSNGLKTIYKGQISLLVFTRFVQNCISLFIFSHEIVKLHNSLIKRGTYLNSA